MEENTNFGTGILGAILGSLPGIILWIILGYFGYTAAIVGFVIAFGILIGYSKLHGPMNGAGMVVCILVMLVAIYLGVHLSYSAILFEWMPNLGSCIFGLYGHLVKRGAILGFLKDLGLGYLFGLIGGVSLFTKMLQGAQ